MEAAPKGFFRLAGRDFPAVTWYKDRALRKYYCLLFFVILTSATNGYDGSMVNGLLALKEFDKSMDHPSGPIVSLFSSIMFLGSMCALPFAPYSADYLGRRLSIAIGCVIMLLGVALQSAAPNFSMFTGARFVLGFGVAIAHGSAPLLITELCHPQHRAVFTAIYNTTWYIGSIIAAWLTLGTNHVKSEWSWRIPSIVMAVPSVLQLSCVWFVPESPRWYVSKNQTEKALATLARIHSNGNTDDEVVKLEFEEIKETIRLEKEIEGSKWTELTKTKGMRHRLIILVSAGIFSQWSGNALVSYYLTGILNTVGITDSDMQLAINGALSTWNGIVAITMCFFVEKFGRRKLFLVSTAGMCLAFVVWTICSERYDATHSSGNGKAVVVMIFIYYTFYNLAWSGLLVGYTVEILPFRVRAKGMTIMFAFIDLALFLNVYANKPAVDAMGWKYFIIYDVWLAIELLVVWKFYIETRNTPLEEIARHFDGDAALVGGAAATEKGRVLAEQLHIHDVKEPVVENKAV